MHPEQEPHRDFCLADRGGLPDTCTQSQDIQGHVWTAGSKLNFLSNTVERNNASSLSVSLGNCLAPSKDRLQFTVLQAHLGLRLSCLEVAWEAQTLLQSFTNPVALSPSSCWNYQEVLKVPPPQTNSFQNYWGWGPGTDLFGELNRWLYCAASVGTAGRLSSCLWSPGEAGGTFSAWARE